MALAHPDRRGSPRLSEDLGIAVCVVPTNGPIPHTHATIFHLTADISARGLRFRHDTTMPAGTLLKIHLALKLPQMTITQFGTVRWCRPTGEGPVDIGVEFVDSPPADMQIWQNYVAQCSMSQPMR